MTEEFEIDDDLHPIDSENDVTAQTRTAAEDVVATALIYDDKVACALMPPDVRRLVDSILTGLRSLPVEQRMEAMGMERLDRRMVPTPNTSWVEKR